MPFQAVRQPRVYIPNKSNHDYRDAKEFGELVILTTGDLNKLKIAQLYREMEPILDEAHPDDYLMIAGPTTANVVAASIIASKFGRINYLIFDGYMGHYVARRVVLQGVRQDARATRESA